MVGFLIRGWGLLIPGCGGTSTLSRGATLTARWLHESQPTVFSQWGWGFHILQGGVDPGDARFRPRVVGVVDTVEGFLHPPSRGKLRETSLG